MVAGAGGNGGFGAFLIGAALIGASFFFPGAGLFGYAAIGSGGAAIAGTGIATTIGTALSAVGAGLVLTGISQMISPTPQPGMELKEANRIQNFTFSGITNTAQQGLAVPIAYGRVVVGSAVISSGLDVDHSPNDPVTSQSLTYDLFVKQKS